MNIFVHMRLLIFVFTLLISSSSFSQSSFDGTLDFGQSKRLNHELTVQKLELGVHDYLLRVDSLALNEQVLIKLLNPVTSKKTKHWKNCQTLVYKVKIGRKPEFFVVQFTTEPTLLGVKQFIYVRFDHQTWGNLLKPVVSTYLGDQQITYSLHQLGNIINKELVFITLDDFRYATFQTIKKKEIFNEKVSVDVKVPAPPYLANTNPFWIFRAMNTADQCSIYIPSLGHSFFISSEMLTVISTLNAIPF